MFVLSYTKWKQNRMNCNRYIEIEILEYDHSLDYVKNNKKFDL